MIARLTITDHLVTIRRGFRTVEIGVDTLTSVKLALRQLATNGGSVQVLDVFVEEEGRWIPLRPRRADPFAMYFALQAAIARAAAGRARS